MTIKNGKHEFRRVYVSEDTYKKIIEFAKKRFNKFGERGKNGWELHKSFKCSLDRFIEENEKQ